MTGKYHRLGGPAVVLQTSEREPAEEYWYVDGYLHRDDGPAEKTADYERWRHVGEVHRANGPAVEYSNGRRDWHVHWQAVDAVPADKAELDRLYDTGDLHRLEMVLAAWQPEGSVSVVELSAAVAAAHA